MEEKSSHNISINLKNMQLKVSALRQVNTISTLNDDTPHSLSVIDANINTTTLISLGVARANIYSIDPNQVSRRLVSGNDYRYDISSNPIRLQLKCSQLNTVITLQTNNNQYYGPFETPVEFVTHCSLNVVTLTEYNCKYYSNNYVKKVSVACSGKNETIITRCPQLTVEPTCYSDSATYVLLGQCNLLVTLTLLR